jgi:hypothetical protein
MPARIAGELSFVVPADERDVATLQRQPDGHTALQADEVMGEASTEACERESIRRGFSRLILNYITLAGLINPEIYSNSKMKLCFAMSKN